MLSTTLLAYLSINSNSGCRDDIGRTGLRDRLRVAVASPTSFTYTENNLFEVADSYLPFKGCYSSNDQTHLFFHLSSGHLRLCVTRWRICVSVIPLKCIFQDIFQDISETCQKVINDTRNTRISLVKICETIWIMYESVFFKNVYESLIILKNHS